MVAVWVVGNSNSKRVTPSGFRLELPFASHSSQLQAVKAKREELQAQVARAVQRNQDGPRHAGPLLECNRAGHNASRRPRWVELDPLVGSLKVLDRSLQSCQGRSPGTWMSAITQAVRGTHSKEFLLDQLELVQYNEKWRKVWLHFRGGEVLLLAAELDSEFLNWKAHFDLYKVPSMD